MRYFFDDGSKISPVSIGPEFAPSAEKDTRNWLPLGKVTVGITAGASCPNNLIEDAIRRLFELRGISVQQLLGD